jgi:hypothetical protein
MNLKNWRKRERIINYLKKEKRFCYCLDEGEAGFYVRTIRRYKNLEIMLSEMKLNFVLEEYVPYKKEGKMVSDHFEFFQYIFGYFFKMKIRDSNYNFEFFDRVAHIFVQTNCAIKFKDSISRQDYEAHLLSALSLGRAKYSGQLSSYKSERRRKCK